MTALLPVLLSLSVFAVFLRSLSPSVSLEDTGELISCAWTLGISHPPGYPWHALLGKLSFLLPVGSPAFRMNLLSASCGALSVFVLWKLLEYLGARFGLHKVLVCLIGAAAFAFSRTAWWQSTIAEKYALATVVFAFAAAALFRAVLSRETRGLLAATFLSGLAISCHWMGIYLLLPLAWQVWVIRSRRLFLLVVPLFSLPLCAKTLYPAIRAEQHPLVNREVPNRFVRWMDYLKAKRYTGRLIFLDNSAKGMLKLVLHHVGVLPWREMGPMIFLSVIGLIFIWKQAKVLAQVALMVVGVNLVLAVIYQTPEIERYFLPSMWVLGVFAGLGGGWLVVRWRYTVGLVALAFVFEVSQSASFAMRDRSYTAADHVRNLLALVPDNSLIIAWGDIWHFPLWHAQIVERMPAARRMVTAEALVFGATERTEHGHELGVSLEEIRDYQEGPTLLWALARMNAPAAVYLTHGALMKQVPSRGARWSGLLIRITEPDAPFGVEDTSRMRKK